MEYNRQPYKGNADTTGWRDLGWFKNKVWPHISIRFPEKVSLVLDVGCGNGRFAPMLRELADEVVAIDPVEDPHPDHQEFAEFRKCHFHDFEHERKFDAIFFMASFMIIQKQGVVDVQKKCRELLKPGGLILMYVERRDLELVNEAFDDWVMSDCDSKTIFVEAT